MPIDPYSPCPGGLGKKVKFCCNDLVGELEKVHKMLEGDQRAACLDYVHKLEGKYQDRACLLAIKSILETSLEKFDDAQKTLDTYQDKYANNPVALAQQASLLAARGQSVAAIPVLLKAIEASKEEIVSNVYEAISHVALALIDAGHVIPARSLLTVQTALSQGQDERPAQMLMAILGDPGIAVALKENPDFAAAPPGCTCKFEFDVAEQHARKLRWKTGADKFTALIPLAGQYKELWQNLGILRGDLADYPGAAEAWHKFAALAGQTDDAVEAEALAQLLERTDKQVDVDEEIFAGFEVRDQNEIETRLSSDKQLERMQFDPRLWGSDEEGDDRGPPPRSMFALLDRPAVTRWDELKQTAEGSAEPTLKADAIPNILGYVLIFGRQTDRPERLLLQVDRSNLAAAEEALRRVAGDSLGGRDNQPEDVLRRRHKVERVLNFEWQLPPDTPPQIRRIATEAERRRRLLEVFPQIPLAQFEGQSLAQVAADPKQRVRALGYILMWEQTIVRGVRAELFNELRAKLGLPVPGPIDPSTVPDILRLPAARLYRLVMDKLTDQQLAEVFHRATVLALRTALTAIAREVVRRPALDDQFPMGNVYEILIATSEDRGEILKYLDAARNWAQKNKHSTAQYDLEELARRLQWGEVNESLRLMEHIMNEHGREPGVGQTLMQLMMQAGLMDQYGRVRRPEPQSKLITPDAGGGEGSKLVLPGGEQPSSGGRSALWVPGAE